MEWNNKINVWWVFTSECVISIIVLPSVPHPKSSVVAGQYDKINKWPKNTMSHFNNDHLICSLADCRTWKNTEDRISIIILRVFFTNYTFTANYIANINNNCHRMIKQILVNKRAYYDQINVLKKEFNAPHPSPTYLKLKTLHIAVIFN